MFNWWSEILVYIHFRIWAFWSLLMILWIFYWHNCENTIQKNHFISIRSSLFFFFCILLLLVYIFPQFFQSGGGFKIYPHRRPFSDRKRTVFYYEFRIEMKWFFSIVLSQLCQYKIHSIIRRLQKAHILKWLQTRISYHQLKTSRRITRGRFRK